MLARKSVLIVALLLSVFSITSVVLSPHAHAQTLGSNAPNYGTYNVVLEGNSQRKLV